MRAISKIVIHCSDSDHAHHDNVESIRLWHLERGFDDIGYHYVITKDGEVHEGRPVGYSGAHAKGHNKSSIGVCLTGAESFSHLQMESLRMFLLSNLLPEYELDITDVYNHNDLDKRKTCPNFDIHQVLTWDS